MGKLSKHFTKESLSALYEKHTDLEISKQFKVTENAVRILRMRWGVPTIPQWQRKELQAGGSVRLSLGTLTPSRLADLYKQMSDRQIGALYGVSKTAISHRRKKWGVQAVSKSERATQNGVLTKEQKQICMGTMLGDGHLLERGVLRLGHTWSQLKYLRWVHRSLQPYSRPIRFMEKEMDTGTLCFSFVFDTVQHVWLKTLRKVFYPEGKRIFPSVVLDRLEPLGLAVWFFDDGHLGDGLPSFALGDISQKEAEEVCQRVRDRFLLDTYVRPASAPTCKIMGVRGRSAEMFFHLVCAYATPDMFHKIPKKYWPQGVLPHLFHKTGEEGIPKPLVESCRKWPSLEEIQRESLLDALVSYWQHRGFPHYKPRPEELETLLTLTPPQVLRKDGVSFRTHGVGQATCQAFAKHIWDARSRGSKQSPLEVFEDSESLRKAFRAHFEMRSCSKRGRVAPMSPAEVRSSIRSWRLSGVYNFRPVIAKILVDIHGTPGGTVYDPCAGYGGRLLGVLLSHHAMSYVGCDPHREGIARLRQMADWVDIYLQGSAQRTALHATPAEDFAPPRCDLVITSPPYWQREEYDSSPLQSSLRYPSYDGWLQGFWWSVLESSYHALRPGGWMLLNVDNFKITGVSYPLVADTLEMCEKLGLRYSETYRYEMPRFSNRDNFEPILALVKPGRSESSHPPLPVAMSLSRCSACGALTSEGDLCSKLCPECSKPSGYPVQCEGCSVLFQAKRKSRRFCTNTCYARYKRAEKAKGRGPIVRTFTCISCSCKWTTEEHGNFKWCPTCQGKRDIAGRTKTCGYRHCGQEFVDTTPKNSMSYCHPEHRRREKLFRSGKATEVGYFKKPDPVLKSKGA